MLLDEYCRVNNEIEKIKLKVQYIRDLTVEKLKYCSDPQEKKNILDRFKNDIDNIKNVKNYYADLKDQRKYIRKKIIKNSEKSDYIKSDNENDTIRSLLDKYGSVRNPSVKKINIKLD